mmetsp:Transcript_8182/g.9253  ORF Transcript_8182/g.9253 Transcript_8182/m.9253 type:complete len:223 (-) Transcript_8182:12-680(-)
MQQPLDLLHVRRREIRSHQVLHQPPADSSGLADLAQEKRVVLDARDVERVRPRPVSEHQLIEADVEGLHWNVGDVAGSEHTNSDAVHDAVLEVNTKDKSPVKTVGQISQSWLHSLDGLAHRSELQRSRAGLGQQRREHHVVSLGKDHNVVKLGVDVSHEVRSRPPRSNHNNGRLFRLLLCIRPRPRVRRRYERSNATGYGSVSDGKSSKHFSLVHSGLLTLQ